MIGGSRLLRGSLLLCLAAALALTGFGLSPSHGEEAAPGKINVGLQLYSLRDKMGKDVAGTLALAQKMGITDVEVAGFGDLNAADFRKQLDAHGLHATGVHFQWNSFNTDIDGVIRDAKTLGCEYVTMPWIPHNDFTAENVKTAAEKFNEWGKKCADAGLKFTYHPHGYEFRPYEDGTLFDLLVKETKPEFVNYELDIFWAYHGGADPVKLMEKYPTRFTLMHLKDMNKSVKVPKYTGSESTENDVALGAGQIDIAAILKEAQKIGIKHYFIEDESKRSVEQIPQSVAYVRSLGM